MTSETENAAPPIDMDLPLEDGAASLPATTDQEPPGTRVKQWEAFQADLRVRANEIASQLPSTVTREKFINASIAAVKQTPSILKASPRSLMAAVIKAAQDGLLPDGREGVITVYNSQGEVVAQWNPMIYGMRKRAREIDGLIVDAQVVHENDHFVWKLGDDAKIEHSANVGDRGKMVAAYAIFRHPDQGIIHREVMTAEEIEKTHRQSKAKNSLMWSVFTTEAWRKVVARRGFKSVPVSAELLRLASREDDAFDFSEGGDESRPLPARPTQDIGARLAAGSKPTIAYVDSKPASASVGPKDAAGAQTPAAEDEAAPDATGGQEPSSAEKSAAEFEAEVVEELTAALMEAQSPAAVRVVADEFAGAMQVASIAGERAMQVLIDKRMGAVQ